MSGYGVRRDARTYEEQKAKVDRIAARLRKSFRANDFWNTETECGSCGHARGAHFGGRGHCMIVGVKCSRFV